MLALALLIGGMNLFTRGEYFSGKIRSYVLDQAKQELGLDVGMDRLVFNFFPAYIDLNRPYVKGWIRKSRAGPSARKKSVRTSASARFWKDGYTSAVCRYTGYLWTLPACLDGHLDIDPLRDKISEPYKKEAEARGV